MLVGGETQASTEVISPRLLSASASAQYRLDDRFRKLQAFIEIHRISNDIDSENSRLSTLVRGETVAPKHPIV